MLSSALALLAARDYSEQKMREKLQKKFPFSTAEERENIIETLKKENYINDERLSENWIHYWQEEGKTSTAMMRQKLLRKKIPKQILEDLLIRNTTSDHKAIATLSEHKWKSLSMQPIDIKKKKEKLIRFLLGKGFAWNDIQAVIPNDITTDEEWEA